MLNLVLFTLNCALLVMLYRLRPRPRVYRSVFDGEEAVVRPTVGLWAFWWFAVGCNVISACVQWSLFIN